MVKNGRDWCFASTHQLTLEMLHVQYKINRAVNRGHDIGNLIAPLPQYIGF